MAGIDNLYKTRLNLYSAYIAELSPYDPEIKSMEMDDIKATVDAYLIEDQLGLGCWIDIKYKDKVVGFFIVSSSECECHPQANYYISQAFISRLYRRRGLTKKVAEDYIKEHPGIVAFDILIGNYSASLFWRKVFSDVGGKYVELPEVRTSSVKDYVHINAYEVGHK